MNKRICCTIGGQLSIVHPAPLARLVSNVTVDGVAHTSPARVPLGNLLGRATLPEGLQIVEGETDDEFAARIRDKDVPPGAVGIRIVDVADIPADRYFRNAWADTGTLIRPPVAAARVVHKKRLLERRDALMAKIREKIDAAEDAGDTALVSTLKAKRAALRNIASKIDTDLAGAGTLAAIKNYVPAEVTEQEA